MKKPVVFFIVGPTASGKTEAAVYAAKRLDGEIVSADSIQIYKNLDIGSAKPSETEKGGVPHHLLDFVDYTDESYNAARFASDASKVIGGILERRKTPLVVGGTGLYINSLLYPLDFTHAEPNREIRDRLLSEEEASPGSLHKRLSCVDPAAANRISPNDLKRTVRALEIYELTGSSMTDLGGDFLNERKAEIPFHPIIAGITMERAVLYERINKRVDNMIQNGLKDEAWRLYTEANRKRVLSLQGIGYKQFLSYFDGEATFDETVELIKRDTRRYAKRQISWFKRDKRIRWFDLTGYSSKDELKKDIVSYFIEERDNYERG